jgi:hypothetical protein
MKEISIQFGLIIIINFVLCFSVDCLGVSDKITAPGSTQKNNTWKKLKTFQK